MCCELFERWVMDWLLHDLSHERCEKMQKHEDNCPQCRRLRIVCKYVLLSLL